MTGVHEFKIANCFVAKLVNIPDIHRVSRLVFDDFNSHSLLAQTYSDAPLLCRVSPGYYVERFPIIIAKWQQLELTVRF